MQIAKMFASLGFNVDTSGLDKFRQNIKLARTDITNMGRDAGTASTKLTGLSKALDGLSNKLDKVSVKKANDVITKSYENVSLSVSKVEKALKSIETNQKGITKALGKIHGSVKAGEPLWDKYRASVVATKEALKDVNGKMKELRANSTVSLKVNQGGGSNSGSQRREQPNRSFFGGMMGGASGGRMGEFFRSMLPSVVLGGGIGAAGFAAKEVVQRGREQQKMENVLQFSSKGLADFNDSLAYVKKTALEVGVASSDLGKAFAQINMSAEGLNKNQKKSLMTNMSTSFAVMGATKDEQGLLFKAVNQMFSLGRIQAEEMNQLTGQGLVPRKLVYDAVKEAYKVKTNEDVQKLQKANKLDPAKIMPIVFQKMMDQAEKTGALAKYKESSQFQQNVALERFNQLSKNIMDGGLDQALAKLFTLLTDLIVKVEDLTNALKTIKKSFDDASGGNGGWIALLILSLPLLGKFSRLISIAVKALKSKGGAARAASVLMRSTIIRTVVLAITKFNFLTGAIFATISAIIKLQDMVKRSNGGEFTFLDFLFVQFDKLMLKGKIFFLRLQLDAINLKKYLTSLDLFRDLAGAQYKIDPVSPEQFKQQQDKERKSVPTIPPEKSWWEKLKRDLLQNPLERTQSYASSPATVQKMTAYIPISINNDKYNVVQEVTVMGGILKG